MFRNHFAWPALLLGVFCAAWQPVTATAICWPSGTFHGRLVDRDTKAPIDDAVVVVIWSRQAWVPLVPETVIVFHRAVEATPDHDGQFAIPNCPGIDWNPFTFVLREPLIMIFAVGYGDSQLATGPQKRKVSDILLEGATIEFRKLTTNAELTKALDISGAIGPPAYRSVPNLFRLLNVQRRRLGLPPERPELVR